MGWNACVLILHFAIWQGKGSLPKLPYNIYHRKILPSKTPLSRGGRWLRLKTEVIGGTLVVGEKIQPDHLFLLHGGPSRAVVGLIQISPVNVKIRWQRVTFAFSVHKRHEERIVYSRNSLPYGPCIESR